MELGSDVKKREGLTSFTTQSLEIELGRLAPWSPFEYGISQTTQDKASLAERGEPAEQPGGLAVATKDIDWFLGTREVLIRAVPTPGEFRDLFPVYFVSDQAS